jgi:DNA-binding transcriptional LysR family regulator
MIGFSYYCFFMSPLRDHLEKLHIFTEISRARSFHAAARRLGRTQPSLSEAMRTLETALGIRLLVRSRQGVEPTKAGLSLLHFSERLLSEVDGMERRLLHPATPMAGSVTIGTFGSLATMLFPRFLIEISEKFPDLEVGLVTLKPEDLGAGLLSRRCHLVVGTGRLPQKSIQQTELYVDEFGGFALPKLSPRARKNILYVAQARDDRGKTLGAHLKSAASTRYDFAQFETVLAMAAEGLGVAVLPCKLAATSAAQVGLEPHTIAGIGRSFGRHQFYCSILREDTDDPRTERVIRELKAYCVRLLFVSHTR